MRIKPLILILLFLIGQTTNTTTVTETVTTTETITIVVTHTPKVTYSIDPSSILVVVAGILILMFIYRIFERYT